jgi:hypothetical protein
MPIFTDGSFTAGLEAFKRLTGPLFDTEQEPSNPQPGDPVSVLDMEWSKEAFYIKSDQLPDESDIIYMYRSSADVEYQDTTPGGNLVINPYPQYTRYADPRRKGLLEDRPDQYVSDISNNLGMGRQYREYLQEGYEPVYFRFGVAEPNSTVNYLMNFNNLTLTRFRTKGEVQLSAMGFVVGYAGSFLATAWIVGPVAALGIAGLGASMNALRTYFGDTGGSYYMLRPHMLDFWLSVNNVVNSLIVEERLIRASYYEDQKEGRFSGFSVNEEDQALLNQLYPELFPFNTGFDVLALVTKSNRRWQRAMKNYGTLFSENTPASFKGKSAEELIREIDKRMGDKIEEEQKGLGSLRELADIYKKVEEFVHDTNSDPVAPTDPVGDEVTDRLREGAAKAVQDSQRTLRQKYEDDGDLSNGFFDYMKAENKMGADFLKMRFDLVEGLSDNFNNNTEPSKVAGMINSASDSFRNTAYELGGVAKDAGAISEFITNAGKFFSGVGQGIDQFLLNIPSGISTLFSGVQAVVPDHWSGSSTDVGRTITLTTTLQATSNHPLARIIGLYLPLACLISAVATRQTGPYAYTSPFLCMAFQRGKFNFPLAIVKSLRLNKATSNTPYDLKGRPLAIEATIEIENLTPSFPLVIANPGLFSTKEYARMMSSDNTYTFWIRSMAGAGMEQMFFDFAGRQRRVAHSFNKMARDFTPATWAAMIHDTQDATGITRVLTGIYKEASAILYDLPVDLQK